MVHLVHFFSFVCKRLLTYKRHNQKKLIQFNKNPTKFYNIKKQVTFWVTNIFGTQLFGPGVVEPDSLPELVFKTFAGFPEIYKGKSGVLFLCGCKNVNYPFFAPTWKCVCWSRFSVHIEKKNNFAKKIQGVQNGLRAQASAGRYDIYYRSAVVSQQGSIRGAQMALGK